jgi:hypothetical protein
LLLLKLRVVSDAFMKLLSNPYDLTGLMLPNDLSIARAGLNPQVASEKRIMLHHVNCGTVLS